MQSTDLDVASGAPSIFYLIIAGRLVPSPFPRSCTRSILFLPFFFFFYCTLTHFLGLQMKFTLHSFIYFTHQNNSGERNLFQWVDVGLFCHGFGESAWCKEVGIPLLQCKLLHNPVIPHEKLTRLGKQRVYSSQGQYFVLFFSLLLQQDRGVM